MACRTFVRVAAACALAAYAVTAARPQAPQSQGGISVDRYRRMFPPAPVNVRAELRDGKAVISWERPPEPPPGKIGYDPAVASYRVYLVGPALERNLLGATTQTLFEDKTPLRADAERHYIVTAVQRSGVESGMSEVAVVRGQAN